VGGGADGAAACSWIIGVHRDPMWSDSMTYACGTTTPCAQGKADKAHVMQSDTNPFVDHRRVFDAEAQASVLKPGRGKEAFPWDPTRDPQLYTRDVGGERVRVSCADGRLRHACYAPPGTDVAPEAQQQPPPSAAQARPPPLVLSGHAASLTPY